MSNNSPSFGPIRVSDNTGDSLIQRIGGVLKISDDGSTFAAPGGGFGSNTIVPLPNVATTPVNALQLQASLTNNGVGTEASQWVLRLLKGGVQAPGGGFGADTYTFLPDTFTLNSTTAKLSLFSDVQIYRDAAFGACNIDSNSGDVVQSKSTTTAMAAGSTINFMQITTAAGFPTGAAARLATAHAAMVFDSLDQKFALTTGGAIWAAAGDNFKMAAALTNADLTRNVSDGYEHTLPAATLSANHSVTLGTAGSPATNAVIRVTRLDVTANTYAVINGGGGAGTKLTFAASVRAAADFKFDGTNWNLDRFWVLN